MSTKRKSGGQAQSDFKRIKAKVGKRAQKPANVTDTSFKSSSLHLAGQTIDRSLVGNTIVSSTRGKSIFELCAQLNHPAAAVRLSAIKGLGDIARNQLPYVLRPHLSTLVPTCAKSWVDEDDEVRNAGLSTFRELIQTQSDPSIRSFAPLIVAYVTSALHSLDNKMRVDGARAVNLVCSVHPSIIRPYVSELLQPFNSLLADRNKLKANEEILGALLSLLEVDTSLGYNKVDGASNHDEPDLPFVAGGRSRNAFFLDSRRFKHRTKPFSTMADLPTFEDLEQTNSLNFGSESIVDELTVMHDMLERLRDILLENIDDVSMEAVPTNNSARKPENLWLFVRSIGMLWKKKTQICATKRDGENEKLDKLAVKIVTILLDVFPYKQSNDAASAENLNSTICTVVMDVSSSVSATLFHDSNGNTLDWMGHLSSFLLPRLHKYTEDKNYSSNSLKVFCNLLMLSFTTADFPESNRNSMLERLQKVFFDTEDAALARSPAGRKVATLITSLVKHLEYRVDTNKHSYGKTMVTIVLKLPFYLKAWGSDFCSEIHSVLCLLHGLGRTHGTEDSIILRLREGMNQLLIASGKKKSKQCTFETYPLPIQRRFLAVMVMFENPQGGALKGLASICAKSTRYTSGENLNGALLADEIITSLQAIRRSIPLKTYLTFLLNSFEPPATTKTKKASKAESVPFESHIYRMLLLDAGVDRATKALIQCGSERVLQMLLPHLSNLLDTSSDQFSIDVILRVRVALSMLGMLSLDIKNSLNKCIVPAKLEHGITQAIFETVVFVSSSEDTMTEKTKLMSPILALFQVKPSFLLSLFDGVVDKLDEYKSQKTVQSNIIQLLIEIVRDNRLARSITGLHRLSSSAHALELKLEKEKGTQKELVGHLKALIDVKL